MASGIGVSADDAVGDLVRWKNGRKSRAVTIEHDNGYGADCWRVALHGMLSTGHVTVYASEVSFFEIAEKDCPRTTVFAKPPWEPEDDDSADDRPGLAATIRVALKRAEELGL